MTPSEYYQSGQLGDAVQAALADVKSRPTDITARYLLAELCCFSGELERADKQFETLMQQSPDVALRVTIARSLIRAEMARQQFFTEGRLPEFLAEATPNIRSYLDASIALRENNEQEAAEVLSRAEEQRPHVAGCWGENAFDDFRDLDDLTAGYFEVLTSTGKYYWVPIERVQSVEFAKPERPLDLLWRRAAMGVAGGPDGEVYVPAIYVGTAQPDDDQLKLGRSTEWTGDDIGFVRGLGLRTFLVGDEARTIMQLDAIEFSAAE